MFSLVTALVSPHTIEVLRTKKDTLITTLTDNANVLCFQPSESVCLLQGEWENIKKAYTVLEELYFRAQAEVMVREMLKGTDVNDSRGQAAMMTALSNSNLSSLFPPLMSSSNTASVAAAGSSSSDTDRTRRWLPFKHVANKHSPTGEVFSPDDGSRAVVARKHRSQAYTSYDATRRKSGGLDDRTDVASATESMVDHHHGNIQHRIDDDDGPPVLSRENINGGLDDVSVASDTSDSNELTYKEQHDASRHKSLAKSAASFCTLNENNLPSEYATVGNVLDVDNKIYLPIAGGSEAMRQSDCNLLAAENQIAAMEKVLLGQSVMTGDDEQQTTSDGRRSSLEAVSPALEPSVSLGQNNSASIALSQHVANAFRNQQYFSDSGAGSGGVDGGGRRLPQFSSLFIGGAGMQSAMSQHTAWPYSDLYSMHLSALHSMQIKQELTSNVTGSVGIDNGGIDDMKDIDLNYRLDGDDSGSVAGEISGAGSMQEMRCTRCDKTYRSEARMKEHVRTHERDYVPILHSCPKCGKSFTYRHNMVVHLRRFHYGWQPAKRHACRICGVKFQKPYLLRLHEHKTHVLHSVSD